MSIYQLPHTDIMIYCLLSGDPIRRAFHIEIHRDMKVSQIRQFLINNKNRFAGKDAEDLILWHVDIPTKDKDLGTTIKVEDIEGGIEMSPFNSVTKYFYEQEHYNQELSEDIINIIVELRPTMEQNPYQTGQISFSPRQEKILEFLQVKFKKLQGIPLITTYGHNFPFVESFISQFKAACKGCDRNERPIFISAGAPGTGKTRNLIETIPMIRSCFPDFATNEIQELSHLLDDPVQILMTYNENLFPLNIEKTLGANSAIGLRILHCYFDSQTYLKDFINQMIDEFGDEPLKQNLDVSMAINIIAKSIRGDDVSRPLLIYIALDEFQKLVGAPFCKGDNEQEKRQYLKEVALALGGAMCCKFSINHVFIICHLAGTLLTPLSNVIASSSYRHITLPIPLLLPIDINSLFEQLQLTKSWWLNSLLLRATAYDIMLPRGIEAFLEYISNSISKGLSPSEIDYIQAADCARMKIDLSSVPSLLAKEILVAIILQLPVTRTSTICTIDNTNYTWEYLESNGILMLHPVVADYYKVIMPYMYARRLVSRCKPDKNLKNLSWLFSNETSIDSGIIDFYWANFELFCCYLQACLEELYYYHLTKSGQPATIMLSDFYRSARIGKCVKNLQFYLADSVHLKISSARFPNEKDEKVTFDIKDNQAQNLDLYTGNMLIKNAEGAPFDSFDIRRIYNLSSWIIRCGQYKYFLNGELTQYIINKESAKTKDALCNYISEGHPWLLWICTTAETNKDVKIPDNVILTDKSSFHQLFGIFATRLQFMMTNKININTAINVNLLKHIVGVGSKYAEQIIENQPYKNENDVKEKLQSLGIPNETILNVLESVEY
ncbi:16210_t:CDS:2 [Gigaspora margarita]|uniref:16210_t:CDS:1 n=1 Tax=Gigaspora margarita TaxID=4874 RepID=A0ABM8W0K4_GIGMA|nr:16210_t:CDS:2 [Gigaspora margarita]